MDNISIINLNIKENCYKNHVYRLGPTEGMGSACEEQVLFPVLQWFQFCGTILQNPTNLNDLIEISFSV